MQCLQKIFLFKISLLHYIWPQTAATLTLGLISALALKGSLGVRLR